MVTVAPGGKGLFSVHGLTPTLGVVLGPQQVCMGDVESMNKLMRKSREFLFIGLFEPISTVLIYQCTDIWSLKELPNTVSYSLCFSLWLSLCPSLCPPLYLCSSLSLPLSLSLSLSPFLPLCLFISLFLSPSLFFSLSASLSFSLFLPFSVSVSVSLSSCGFVSHPLPHSRHCSLPPHSIWSLQKVSAQFWAIWSKEGD